MNVRLVGTGGVLEIDRSPDSALSGELILYTKPGCHLCAEAEAMLAPLLREAGRTMRSVDITADTEAAHRFGLRVPVLVCGVRELCWGRLDRAALRALFGLRPSGRRWR